MLGQVHEHIVKELGESSRTDTIFVLTAIVFNLIVLGINFSVATEAAADADDATYDIILVVFIAMTVLLNIVAVAALVMAGGPAAYSWAALSPCTATTTSTSTTSRP